MTGPGRQSPWLYLAFISYSWKDKPFAVSLHRRLEHFAVPAQIRKPISERWGISANRVRPVFRDDDEIAMSGQLDVRLRDAIDASSSMILLASPDAAKSRYVNDEIAHFIATRGLDRLIVIAVGGERNQPPQWPPALQPYANGLLWVDCRGGQKLDRRGLVRVAAAVLDVQYDTLWQRHKRRLRKLIGAACLGVVALVATFAVLISQQSAAKQLSPERQRAEFEQFLTDTLTASIQEGVPVLAEQGIKYQIVRSDDLNGDGLLDYVVYDESSANCGSGGCSLLVYLTNEPGSYEEALLLQGASNPRMRGSGESTELAFTDYSASREPVYTVYRLVGEAYELSHYEFCDGITFEACDPAVFEPVGGLKVLPQASIHARPDSSSAPATIGAGSSSSWQEGWPPVIFAESADSQWYLAQVWKGAAGFVPAEFVGQ